MIVLYAIAREAGWRVLGTGNKSEILLGYFTKYRQGCGADRFFLLLGIVFAVLLVDRAERDCSLADFRLCRLRGRAFYRRSVRQL